MKNLTPAKLGAEQARLEGELARIQHEEEMAVAFEAAGGVVLDEKGKPEVPVTLQDIGIVNRRTARRNGLRNPKRERRMAVPKGKRR